MFLDTLTRKGAPGERIESGGKPALKMISSIIRPEKLDEIKEGFKQIDLVGGVTVTNVRGFGRQRGLAEHYMGLPYQARLLDKVKLDIVVTSDDVPDVIGVISRLARTGQVGDGKIFVTDVLNAQRIRTGEKGADAL